MKKIFCLLLTMLLLCSTALAEPRYPEKQNAVTDAAAVLSQSTVRDLIKFADEVEDETPIRFYVCTVDFLDGVTLAEYAEGLRAKWDLGDDDLLLLLSVGEDKFGSFGGKDVNRKLSTQVQDKLLSTSLEAPFLRQQYDEAISQYIPALSSELGKAFDEQIKLSGLFGSVSKTAVNWAEDWSQRWSESNTRTRTNVKVQTGFKRVTQEDKDTGFSLGKVILTVVLLMVIFGKKNRRGCGCAPFSSILAGLGPWKLWDNK